MNYGPKLLLAIVTYIIGTWLIKKLTKLVDAYLEKSNIDISLRGFLKSLISVILKLVLIISVVTMLIVETTSLIAVPGAAGLSIGLALREVYLTLLLVYSYYFLYETKTSDIILYIL